MSSPDPPEEVVEISEPECWRILASTDVGRIAIVEEGFPLVLPVNYRVAELGGSRVIAIRTRPGNVIDHPGRQVCFEVDWVDTDRRGGGSVLVRGRLASIEADPAFDSHPILSTDRGAWLALVPTSTTGRLIQPPAVWAFHIEAYL